MNEFKVKETIEALKIHLAEYLNTVWKTFAALMVTIGWLLSSEDSRSFIHNNQIVKYGILVGFCILAIAHFSTLIELHTKSKRVKSSLGMEEGHDWYSLLKTYEIPSYYPISSFITNLSLFITAFIMVVVC